MATAKTNPLPDSEDISEEVARARALAVRYRLEFVEMSEFRIDQELFRSIPADLMLRYGFVPHRREGRSLVIVVSDPTDLPMIDELGVILRTPIRVTVGAPSAIQSILKKSESSQRVLEEATEGFELQVLKEDETGDENLTVERLTSDISPIIKLVDHRKVGRIGHNDHERPALSPMRNEAIPQHQICGNRSEQLLIDAELTHLHEFQAIADRQGARPCDLFGEVVGVRQRIHFRSRHYEPTTDVNSNNGMYNASTTMAMMIPMNTSKTGSTKVMKRPTSVSISSS